MNLVGLREKKKEEIRRQIVQSARDCFLTQGFEETTIADIAKKANIGIGTFYNYFPSKAALFIESYYQELGDITKRLDTVLKDYGNNPADTIVKITAHYLEPFAKIDRRTCKELFAVFADSLNKHHELINLYLYNDYQYIEFLSQILSIYKNKGILAADLDAQDGSMCIYSIILAQILFYMVDEKITLGEVQHNISRQVNLFFRDKNGKERDCE